MILIDVKQNIVIMYYMSKMRTLLLCFILKIDYGAQNEGQTNYIFNIKI